MKDIRVKALLAFVISLSVIAVLSYLFAGTLLKWILQSQLTAANGAEVNIAEVKLGVSPLQLRITGIEVTDKETPKENLVEIDSAQVELSTGSLLKSKVIIRDLSIENIRFSTQRASAGKIVTEADDEGVEQQPLEKSEGVTTASLELPDIDRLMDNAGLQTPAVFDALDKKADAVKQSWAEMEAYLDDKKKWDSYNSRYEKIKADYKKGNTKARLKALKALKKLNKEIKKDLKTFSVQRKNLKNVYNELKAAYKKAKQTPDEDLNKIKNSYQLDGAGMENISRVLFGENITGYLVIAKKYYKKIQPYLETEETVIMQVERQQGRYVHFKDFNPEPDFLVEKARFSAMLPSGEFVGSAKDITADQHKQNKPSVVKLSGKNLKHSEAEDISLTVDLRSKKERKLNFTYDISGRQINDYKVAAGDTLPLMMNTAQLDLKSNIKYQNKRINGIAEGKFTQVKFSSQRDTSGRNLASMIASSIEKVSDFNVDVRATGKALKPELKIKSDIDNKVNKQLKHRFKQIKTEYEKEIKEKFKQRYGDKIKSIEDKMASIDNYKLSLESSQDALKNKLSRYKK